MALSYLIVYLYLITITISLLPLISQMVLYKNKGKHAWAALIPIYSQIVKFKIAGLSPWLVLLYLVPVANIVIEIISTIKFFNAYGKDTGFAVGAIFLPNIFYPLAAFPVEGNEGAKKADKKVSKALYAVLTILFGGIGINKFYAGKIKEGILSILFCWTLIPTVLSMVEFVVVLSEKADKKGKISAFSTRRKNALFGTTLVIFVAFIIGAIIPWETIFPNFSFFTELNGKLAGIKIGNYAIFGNIIGLPMSVDKTTGATSGSIAVFGNWAMNDISIFLIIITLVMYLFNDIKFDDFIKLETNSIKKVLPIAITAMFISVVLVVTVTTGINITIVNAITKISKGFNVATTSLASLFGSALVADFYYYISTVGKIVAINANNKEYYTVIAFIMQSIYNVVMMIAPVSVGLLIGLYFLDIPYNKWFKYIWKVLLVTLLVVIITAIILYLFVINKTVVAIIVSVVAFLILAGILMAYCLNKRKRG